MPQFAPGAPATEIEPGVTAGSDDCCDGDSAIVELAGGGPRVLKSTVVPLGTIVVRCFVRLVV